MALGLAVRAWRNLRELARREPVVRVQAAP
jgi:hypothetical protein